MDKSLQKSLQDHLESCKRCQDHQKHLKALLSAILNQTTPPLSPQMRKDPFSVSHPFSEAKFLSLSRWQRIPWLIRTVSESLIITVTTLCLVMFSPYIKTFYDKQFGKSSSEIASEGPFSNIEDEPRLDLTDQPESSLSPQNQGFISPSNTEGIAPQERSRPDLNDLSQGQAELWRFTLKTVSPDELKIKVIEALTQLNIPRNFPGMNGNQVPGGIEFDLILPKQMIPRIRESLQLLASSVTEPSSSIEAQHSSGKEESSNFTWYKVKSKRAHHSQQVKVVIWLSQLN